MKKVELGKVEWKQGRMIVPESIFETLAKQHEIQLSEPVEVEPAPVLAIRQLMLPAPKMDLASALDRAAMLLDKISGTLNSEQWKPCQ
jgi:hypothetical protein